MNCHPDRSEPGNPGERSGGTCGSLNQHPTGPEAMLLFIGSSLTRRRQVSSGMNNVHEVVTIAITPNGSAALPFVIPSVAEGSAVQSFGPNEFVIPTGAKRSGGTCGSLDEHPIRPVAPFCSLGAYPDFLLAVLGEQRVRFSVMKTAWSSSTSPTSTGNPDVEGTEESITTH
jgi:hypothetical protein